MTYAYEKRDFERVKTNTALTLFYGSSPKEIEGVCIDLSDNGIGLELDRVIPIGTECYVKVHDGHRNRTTFQALIEVKRILPIDKGRCRVGALILEMF